MAYRAGPGPGLFGGYAFPDTRPKIDVGGVIDAFTGGASSLIHAAYQRKVAQNNIDLANREQAVREQALQVEQQREAREAANQDREFGLKQESERHRFIEQGGIPASTTVDTTPNTLDISSGFKPNLPTSLAPAPTANDGQSPIARAMSAGVPTSVAPTAAPAPTTVPNRMTTTPESFDPMRSATTARQLAVQDLRNQGFMTRAEFEADARSRLEDQKNANTAARAKSLESQKAKDQQDAIRLRQKLGGGTGTGGGSKPMTGGQWEQAREKWAGGLIDLNGGSYDQAVAYLNSPAGKWYRDNGVTAAHLSTAHSQTVKGDVAAALRAQTGLTGDTPDESVQRVQTTRRLMNKGDVNDSTAAPGATPAPTATTPAAPRTVAKPATPAAKPSAQPAPRTVARPPASGADTSSSSDDFTDAEVLAAHKAGKRTDADIAAYIKQQRRTKKAGGPA